MPAHEAALLYSCPLCDRMTLGPDHPCARPCEPVQAADVNVDVQLAHDVRAIVRLATNDDELADQIRKRVAESPDWFLRSEG